MILLVVVEIHSATVANVLRFVVLTNGRIKNFSDLSNRQCRSSPCQNRFISVSVGPTNLST